ncbi:MAG: hypothetical protein L6Q54_08555 [Leptospiraceae bacterium]|nr:hypothetical protein [Leptospiraceae bacterium]MCK6381284.1 hypothetical protein [Leptospiraceae bacterium]NUM40403.1 hypothetical protein [Leptospiraceae bacterium]
MINKENEEIETSLGPSLIRNGEVFELNLSNLRVFTGLSVLSKILGDEVLNQVENTPGDVSIIYKINPNINPELVEMNFSFISIYARSGVLKDILSFKEEFQDHLRTVFGTFQRPSWGKRIHPEFFGEDPKVSKSLSLIFPFHHVSENESIDYRFILERVENPQVIGDFFFRLTVENYAKANLDIQTIPHIIVNDIGKRVFLAGSTRIAETINNGIQVASSKGQKNFSEERRDYSHLFEQISRTQLGDIERIDFSWDKTFSDFFQKSSPETGLPILKKIFLMLEDNALGETLKKGHTLKVNIGKIFVTMYLSRLGRVLNCNFNLSKKTKSMLNYLKRMPELHSLADKKGHNLDFGGINIFLVHHITSEILALLEAFHRLNSGKIHVAFVKYGGIVPSAYLDVLLDIPTENFFMAGLSRRTSEKNKDYYVLSKDYSDTSEMKELKEYLEQEELNFFDAMKLLSGHLLLKFCIESEKEEKKVMLIEDGGYLAPFFNDYISRDLFTKEVFEIYKVTHSNTQEKFSIWIKEILIGSVEHTRNGYDRLKEVETKHSSLNFPTYSIAISDKKVKEESKEVAHSVLSAIEAILHGQGMVLSQRKMIVLGSRGNIGRFLCKYLKGGRMHESNQDLAEVDIKKESGEFFYNTLDEIPREIFLSRDLFIGVIGKSVLKEELISDLILHGTKSRIVFASGSTKTVEFSELSDFLNKLSSMKNPSIRETPIEIDFDRIIEPQSGIDHGGKVQISFEKNGEKIEKVFYLLGDLSPVNFIFYGVPTETMDSIISELLTISLGLSDQYRNGKRPHPKLYAVDFEIDRWGNLIEG